MKKITIYLIVLSLFNIVYAIAENEKSILASLQKTLIWFTEFDDAIAEVNDEEVLKKTLRVCGDTDRILWEIYQNKSQIYESLKKNKNEQIIDDFSLLLSQLNSLKKYLNTLSELLNRSKIIEINSLIQNMQYSRIRNEQLTDNEIRLKVFNSLSEKDMSEDLDKSLNNTKKIREDLSKIMDKIRIKLDHK